MSARQCADLCIVWGGDKQLHIGQAGLSILGDTVVITIIDMF